MKVKTILFLLLAMTVLSSHKFYTPTEKSVQDFHRIFRSISAGFKEKDMSKLERYYSHNYQFKSLTGTTHTREKVEQDFTLFFLIVETCEYSYQFLDYKEIHQNKVLLKVSSTIRWTRVTGEDRKIINEQKTILEEQTWVKTSLGWKLHYSKELNS